MLCSRPTISSFSSGAVIAKSNCPTCTEVELVKLSGLLSFTKPTRYFAYPSDFSICCKKKSTFARTFSGNAPIRLTVMKFLFAFRNLPWRNCDLASSNTTRCVGSTNAISSRETSARAYCPVSRSERACRNSFCNLGLALAETNGAIKSTPNQPQKKFIYKVGLDYCFAPNEPVYSWRPLPVP